MEKKIISYSLEHLQDSKFQLEILTNDGVKLFQGDITDCQKHINYFIYDNPNAKFGSEPNEVLNSNNNEYVDYRQQVTEQFNPRLFNKPSKELPTDEEIYELAEKILAVDYLSFTEGAKWMRDKIKGGDNE
jgi:hypothetical protein